MSLIIGEQISKEVSKSKSSLKQQLDNGNLIGKESEQPADCSNSPSSATIANQPMSKEDTENGSNLGVSGAVSGTEVKGGEPVFDVRQALAEQMGNFACVKTEDTIVGELVKNAVEEHLLLEYAFEMVLRNLLREPGAGTESSQSSQPPQTSIQQAKPS